SLVVASMTSSFACAQQPSTWTLASLSGPVSRSNAAMCFFPSAHSAILFGGVGFNNVLTNQDTWFWFGGSWLPLTLPNAPPARHSAGMVRNPPHHRLLMMGGLGASNFLNDTWQFKLNPAGSPVWSQIQMQFPPAVRADAAMVFDTVQQEVLLFGGFNSAGLRNDMFRLAPNGSNGEDWVVRGVAGPPSPRSGHTMAMDERRGLVLLHGGVTANNVPSSELFEFDNTQGPSAVFVNLGPQPVPGG